MANWEEIGNIMKAYDSITKEDLFSAVAFYMDENKELKQKLHETEDGFEYWELKHNRLKEDIRVFLDKNFTGGAKSDRENYTQMVSCKDIWDLRELIK